MSQISFAPSIRQSMIQGMMMGFTFRYTEERNFGLIAELNIEQRGWKEDFEEAPFEYSRTLTYIQIPMLTHIYFGSRKFKGFVNLGPEFGYMISSNTKSNFNYSDIASIPEFPALNRMTEQLTTEVKKQIRLRNLGRPRYRILHQTSPLHHARGPTLLRTRQHIPSQQGRHVCRLRAACRYR